MLASEGVVELVHNRGARVVSWTAEEIDEVYRLRALLEGHGAALAATRATPADLDQLNRLEDRFELAARGRSASVTAQCNNELHAAVLRCSGSPRLATLLDVISSAPLVTQAMQRYADDDVQRSILQHRDILTAIAHGDSELAEAAMRSHILAARMPPGGSRTGSRSGSRAMRARPPRNRRIPDTLRKRRTLLNPVGRPGGRKGEHREHHPHPQRHGGQRHRDRARPTSWSTARPSRRCWRPVRPCSGWIWPATSTRWSTRPASTSSPAASTPTPTWSCRSAAPTPPTPSRPAPGPRPGAAPRAIIDFAVQRYGERVEDGLAAWHAKAAGNCAIDYGFHQIIGGVDEFSLKAMDTLIDEGVTSFKLFMAYPGVFYSDDAQILRAMQKSAETGLLTMMHAENGPAIDVLAEQLYQQGKTDPYYHGIARAWQMEEEATHRAIMLAHLTGAPLYVVHVSAKQAVAQIAAARDAARTCSARPARSTSISPWRSSSAQRRGLRGGQVGLLDAAAVPGRGPPGRHVAGPAHQRPADGVHRSLPVLHEGAEGAGHR